MYLKIKNKKIEVKELISFKDRFKSLKFYLYPLDFGLYFPNRRLLNTNFFCQRVDACFLDHDYKILYLYENLKSEKRIFKRKAKHLLILPLGSCQELKVGDIISFSKK